MLKQRVFTAAVLLALTIAVLFFIPAQGFTAVCWILCLIGIYELTKIYKFDVINQVGLMLILTLLAFLLYFCRYDPSQLMCIIAVLTWCFMVPFILIVQPKKFSKLMISIFAAMIFIPAFYALINLYNLLGAWRLVSIMAIAWVSDIGAYFIGQKFGKHKLAAKISPGKTVEGAFGGLILVIIYLLCLKLFAQTVFLYSFGAVFKFALILTTAGIVGDLFESWLKRVAGVKDSGVILPGHGGVFDRIDSLLAIVAVCFAMIWGMI
ncbi:MAG: phosphatidate cytidylyltransferase [Gammaproteobacteria bacterium]|nr:phosphatidate cytidylyltransferase [Gammaproteobacteria bacterium]